jgi:hypothetical protein
VEGTTFDPTTGGVCGLTSLDRNLEVMAQSCASANMMTAQDINQMHYLHAVLHVVSPGITFVWVNMRDFPVSCDNAVYEPLVPQLPHSAGLLKPAVVTCRLCLRYVLSAMMLTSSSRMADTTQWVHPQRPPL